MEEHLKVSLLGSISAGRLAIICGAGLSMASPSRIPPARDVSRICFDRYAARIDNTIDPAIRDNLEAVAEWAKARVDFAPVFIKSIVPWDQFAKRPNQGHEAVADFAVTRAVAAALTSNYDNLVERSAYDFGSPFPVALDGGEATATTGQSPFLKFHGCGYKDQPHTIWAPSQFVTDAEAARRKASCENWIQTNLQEKDLLFVGFWSDWAYLNAAISHSFSNTRPRSITLVDPGDAGFLQEKAPDLWALANQEGVTFQHIRESGDQFLADLRRAFSEAYLRELMRLGTAAFTQLKPRTAFNAAWQSLPPLTNDQLYSWRRDAEGCAADEPAKKVLPDATAEVAGLTHLLMRSAGWSVTDLHYENEGRTARIVNAAGRLLNDTKKRFTQAPALIEAEIVICAGATDLVVPGDIIRDQDPANVVRGGSSARWVDLVTAIEELHL